MNEEIEIIKGKLAQNIIFPYVGRLKTIHTISKKLRLVNGINLHGAGFFEGQSFEKNEETKYNTVKYKLIHYNTGKIVDEAESNNGYFKFDDLNENEIYSIIVTDMSNKYIGKVVEKMSPDIDLTKSMKITRLYQTNNSAYFKVKINGDINAVSLFAVGAVVTKVKPLEYKLSNINGSYTVTLHDYVDNVLYIREEKYLNR